MLMSEDSGKSVFLMGRRIHIINNGKYTDCMYEVDACTLYIRFYRLQLLLSYKRWPWWIITEKGWCNQDEEQCC